jgi:hypothetical protein
MSMSSLPIVQASRSSSSASISTALRKLREIAADWLDSREKGMKAIVFSNSTNRDVAPPRANNWDELEGMILLELDPEPRLAQPGAD